MMLVQFSLNIAFLFVILCCCCCHHVQSIETNFDVDKNRNTDNDSGKNSSNHVSVSTLRWASSGGGLRAMTANIGYAHLFHKAGLFPSSSSSSSNTTESSSSLSTQFSAISSNSGGTWFTIQFFYSLPFYNNIITSNTSHTYQFILDWLQTYKVYLASKPSLRRNVACVALSLFRKVSMIVDDLLNVCDFFTYNGPLYADYVKGMLQTASTEYNDPEFSNRLVNTQNRIQPLQNTEYYIQTTLATNTKYTVATNRTRLTGNTFLNQWSLVQPNYYTYIGPYLNTSNTIDMEQSTPLLYTIPLSVQYVVRNINVSYFHYAVEKQHLPLQSYWSNDTTSPIGSSIQLNDWDDYPLYPSSSDSSSSSSIYMPITSSSTSPTTKWYRSRECLNNNMTLSLPFQGRTPNTVQIAAASSTTFALFSSSIPSILAQYISVRQYDDTIINNNKNKIRNNIRSKLLNRIIGNFLTRTILLRRDLALCSQWPYTSCGPTDTYFLDGGFTDGPSLAGNIAQYQTAGNNHNTTIKVILTNHNYVNDTNMKFLSYFNTTFNRDIDPGDLLWQPSAYGTGFLKSIANFHPIRSIQIFHEYMDDTIMFSKFQSVPNTTYGSNITSAIYEATTIDNEAYGIIGGQKVQILLLQINSLIPTNLIVQRSIDKYGIQYANLAYDIMSSTVLVDRIKSFLAM